MKVEGKAEAVWSPCGGRVAGKGNKDLTNELPYEIMECYENFLTSSLELGDWQKVKIF